MSIHKIAAKLTVLCAILDERATADADLPQGRIKPALRLAREASALASAEQARLATVDATLRPAVEIAREMVRVRDVTDGVVGIAVTMNDGKGTVTVDVGRSEEVDDLIALIARVLDGGRAEGERERRDVREQAAERRSHADGIVDGLRKARSIVFATVSGEIEDELNRGIDEVTARTSAAAQPRDLAGRIRALVIAWADRLTSDDTNVHDVIALDGILRFLQKARRVAGGTMPEMAMEDVVAEMRAHASRGVGWVYRALEQAADELEAIVRDHDKEGAK